MKRFNTFSAMQARLRLRRYANNNMARCPLKGFALYYPLHDTVVTLPAEALHQRSLPQKGDIRLAIRDFTYPDAGAPWITVEDQASNFHLLGVNELSAQALNLIVKQLKKHRHDSKINNADTGACRFSVPIGY